MSSGFDFGESGSVQQGLCFVCQTTCTWSGPWGRKESNTADQLSLCREKTQLNTTKEGKNNYKNILAFVLHTNYIMYQSFMKRNCCVKPSVVPKTFREKIETTRRKEEGYRKELLGEEHEQ